MSQKILITSALPYANGILHLGHIAGAYLPGDCYARFQRLRGKDVLYLCGSDEYGVAIALSAQVAGRSPQEHVDIYHDINQQLFKELNFSFDHYSRTTWKGHIETTYQYFEDLQRNGYIYEQVTDQLYSEHDQMFLADRYVIGECPRCGFDPARGDECPKCAASYESTDLKNPRSKLTGASLILKPTKHWFLDLPQFKERLHRWIEQKSWKPNVVHFIQNYIGQLRPRAITRDLKWGIPLPAADDPGKVLYVWFDAPIGYISAAKEWAQLQGNSELWRNYWCDQSTKLVHFIGKDNIPFHSVIFPAMTMGQDQPYKLVDELPANEFYLLEGKQFSKSDGWFLDIQELLHRYNVDQIRYTIAATAPETADSEFTWQAFQMHCNAELLGKYGNFAHRTLIFAQNQCLGKVPARMQMQEVDHQFLSQISSIANETTAAFESFHLRKACQLIMELAQAGNVYFNAKKPWAAAKNPDTRFDMQTTIVCCIECLKALALLSCSIMPQTAGKLWAMLGYTKPLQSCCWDQVLVDPVPVDQILPIPEVLFQKIEDAQIQQEIEKLHALSQWMPQAVKYTIEPLKELVSIDQFDLLDLRVGQVIEVQKVPKSKKLLKLIIDIGLEKRTILSGISVYYEPKDLIGKKVVVIANLKTATIMGIESQGMLLSASIDKQLECLQVQDLPPGSCIG